VGFELNDADPDVRAAMQSAGAEPGNLLSEDDIREIGEGLEPNTAAAVLVWEDLWAAPLAQTIRDAGGVLTELQRVPHETVMAAREFAAANA
jgi:hypothetical protein